MMMMIYDDYDDDDDNDDDDNDDAVGVDNDDVNNDNNNDDYDMFTLLYSTLSYRWLLTHNLAPEMMMYMQNLEKRTMMFIQAQLGADE